MDVHLGGRRRLRDLRAETLRLHDAAAGLLFERILFLLLLLVMVMKVVVVVLLLQLLLLLLFLNYRRFCGKLPDPSPVPTAATLPFATLPFK